MRKTTILGILALLVVLAMPTASATEYYLVQDNSSVANPGDCTTVSVWLNATQGVMSGLFTILYDSNCADIPSFTYNNTCFVDPPTVAIVPGRLTCGYANMPGGIPAISPCTPGLVHLGDFEICCNTTTPPCQTDLVFYIGPDTWCTGVWDMSGAIPFTVNNGSFTCGTPADEVDLNVTDIDVNPGCNIGHDEIFVNQSNEICATVYNAGPDGITGDFDVSFYDDANGVYMGSATVTGGLLAGANTAVCIFWTPSCADYPGLCGEHPAIGIPATVNATVDCNNVIVETDEGNNMLLLVTEVSANGYKSKNFDCGSSDPLDLFMCVGDQFYGGLEYNVSGTKVYPFDPGMNQTRVHHIDLPSCATTVKEARLYITWYDYFYNPVPGCLANLSVNFTGPCGSETFTTPDAMYTDQKAYDGWDTPKGKYAYNVTDWVCATASNDYSVTVENIDPTNSTTLLGGILVVVYEGDDCEHIGLCWLEGCDLLSGRTAYCSSTTEATATVVCPGNIPLSIVNSTELVTIVDQGMEPGSNLLFNGNIVKTDAWDAPTEAYPDSKINIETYDVPMQDLFANGNTIGFQDTGTAGMQANLAFLKVTKKSEVVVAIDPCPAFVYPEGNVTVNITLSGIADYGSGTITLSCEPCDSSAYALIESVGPGDSGSVTHSPLNDDCVTISASNIDGLSGDVRFATVTLKPMGNPGECICLKLVVDTLYDRDYNALQTVVDNCTCCTGGGLYIIEDDPPFIVSAIADPPLIYNNSCPGCPRCTNLTVTVTDATGVAGVWVDLTPILGPGYGIEQMCGPDGSTSGVWWCRVCANYSRPLDPYCLNVTAVDLLGNWNDDLCIPLEVRRVGDVNLDNKVDAADYLIIAQYTVGLRPAPDLCLGDIVPPADPDGIINMGDALYIAMYATIPGYPEIGSLCPCPCLGPCP